ncbi:hypothetical protein HYH03_017249 [Edaphochlamys debaryana]|uniref:tRNA (guanine(9)-N(1))-methyltransferase n=1 Tax=Edaphochlamys debaryana TaxID=47281 RepID=A0A836BQT1_9CHLO|nr:hypothetical protein HYH03_017249 [Edaphochlamys debaryana]|eukprot:KAG2483928.1 hypothetical protein HYH03_017249 [Edaphochlamys debaryana]
MGGSKSKHIQTETEHAGGGGVAGATHASERRAPVERAGAERDESTASVGDAPSTSGRKSKADRASEFEEKRRLNNSRRTARTREAKKSKKAAQRAAEQALVAAMTEEELAAWRAAKAAERDANGAAVAAQVARVAAALANGGPGSGPDVALRVVIDCSFAPDAPAKELRSLCKQIENAAALNKFHPTPCCLTVTSWREPLPTISGNAGWRVVKMEEGATEAFPPEKVVVLSPDATEPLEGVDTEHVYVIGGIVDRTHRKGVTLKYAEAQQVACRRLPIAENAEALGLVKGTRKNPILNIDSVVAALLLFRDTGDWVQALDAAIPQRKRKPQLKGLIPPQARSGAAPGAHGAEAAAGEEQAEGAEDSEQSDELSGQGGDGADEEEREEERGAGREEGQGEEREEGTGRVREAVLAGAGGGAATGN